MKTGLFLAILAMALFGLSFFLPIFCPTFTGVEIAIGRYLVFGILSTGLTFGQKLPLKHWKMAGALAFAGYVGYYSLLVMGMRLSSPAMGTLINGALLPISVSLYGNLKSRTFSALEQLPNLCLILLGLVVVHIDALYVSQDETLWEGLMGAASVLLAVGLWTWFSVANGLYLRKHPSISASTWSSFMGLMCLTQSIFFAGALYFWNPTELRIFDADLTAQECGTFIAISLVLGIGGTWMTSFLWNLASLRVPMAILGQMIVFECIFGLSYIYSWEMQIPNTSEILGFCLVFGGLLMSFRRLPKLVPN